MRYDNDIFGFYGGRSCDIDGYFTVENFEAMFGECELSEEEMAELREQAHAELDGEAS